VAAFITAPKAFGPSGFSSSITAWTAFSMPCFSSIGLAPAVYKIKLSARSFEPSQVTVRSGRFRHVDFSIDTGIR